MYSLSDWTCGEVVIMFVAYMQTTWVQIPASLLFRFSSKLKERGQLDVFDYVVWFVHSQDTSLSVY